MNTNVYHANEMKRKAVTFLTTSQATVLNVRPCTHELTIIKQSNFCSNRTWPLPWKPSSIFVPVFEPQATCGLDVQMAVQLINEHQVYVELLGMELQAQVSKALYLQQGAF